MPNLIALKEFPFGPPGQRQQLKKGDAFVAKQKIARLLVAARMAKEAPEPGGRTYQTRHLEAAPAPQKTRGTPVAAMTSGDLRALIQKHHGNVRGLSQMRKPALVKLASKVLK